MRRLKDRSLLILVALIAAVGAYAFWNTLGEFALITFPLIALYAYVVERPKFKQ